MAPTSRMTARVMIVDLILVVSVSPVIPRDECGQGIPRMTSEFRSKFVVVSTWVRPGKWGCGAIQHWHVECISEGEMQERRTIYAWVGNKNTTSRVAPILSVQI